MRLAAGERANIFSFSTDAVTLAGCNKIIHVLFNLISISIPMVWRSTRLILFLAVLHGNIKFHKKSRTVTSHVVIVDLQKFPPTQIGETSEGIKGIFLARNFKLVKQKTKYFY